MQHGGSYLKWLGSAECLVRFPLIRIGRDSTGFGHVPVFPDALNRFHANTDRPANIDYEVFADAFSVKRAFSAERGKGVAHELFDHLAFRKRKTGKQQCFCTELMKITRVRNMLDSRGVVYNRDAWPEGDYVCHGSIPFRFSGGLEF